MLPTTVMQLSLQIKLSKLRCKSISGKQLGKIVEKKGWVVQRITGSHYIYESPKAKQIPSIPVHRNQDLKVGTLKALMKIAQQWVCPQKFASTPDTLDSLASLPVIDTKC